MSGKYPAVASGGLFLANVDAGDGKFPVIPVVEVEKHRAPLGEDLGDQRLFHSRIVVGLPDIGEEGVVFLAVVGIVQIIAELEAVIEIEFQRLDKRLSQIIERVFSEEANRGAELLVSNLEDVGLHWGIFKSDHRRNVM